MLLDSNTIIYISKDLSLSEPLHGKELFASMVSRVEVLGFHKITEEDEIDINNFLNSIEILEFNFEIGSQAINLRQKKNMSLGDAIIAATALVHKLPLVTANVDDLKWIKELEIINPLSEL